MIRKACLLDLHNVMVLVKKTIAVMRTENNPQWNETYPAKSDFLADIANGHLFVCENDGAIEGIVCVNCVEPKEYAPIGWSKDAPCTVIHRMAVLPDSRGKGIGQALIAFAEELARQNNTFYLRSDTYGTNQKMNALLQKNGYALCGALNFAGIEGDFNCYEKILTP